MSEMIDAWHFVRENRKLRFVEDTLIETGKTYSCTGDPVLCQNGMHASRRVIDALTYAPGLVLCRVRLWGDVAEGHDKLAARHRQVLSMRDVSSELRLWACWCIRQTAWDLVTDERSRKAVEVAERFASGEATEIELMTARSAAREVMRDLEGEWGAPVALAFAACHGMSWEAAGNALSYLRTFTPIDDCVAELERRMAGLFELEDATCPR